jgi:hypothetical protein
MHFSQGEQVMRAGKHVLVEIPGDGFGRGRREPGEDRQGDRRHRDGRPCAALQSEPSVQSTRRSGRAS